MLEEQPLRVYIKVLIGLIRTIVSARNPATFEQVKQFALFEEIEQKTDQTDNRGFQARNNNIFQKINYQPNNNFNRNNNNFNRNNNFNVVRSK